MSIYHLSPRALAAMTIVPLCAALACASRTPNDTQPAARRVSGDTAASPSGDAKTIESLFAGRFPGVSVTTADGGGLKIRIRGAGTLYGNDEPLFIVDDTPLPSGSNGIVFLNPYDIQKIEVLKNPNDTGVYGTRGANGVIKITTLRPRGR